MAGRKGEKIWADAVRRAVMRRMAGEAGKPKKLEHLADRLVDAALGGDIQALKEVGDRLDGRPAQAVTGDGGGPVEHIHRIERRIVGSDAQD